MDAYNEQGGAFKRKEDMHRMAEANRVYAKAIVQYSDAMKAHDMFTLADETSVLHTATDTEKAAKYLQGQPKKGDASPAPAQ